VILFSSPAPQRVYCGAQAPHRQAAEDRTPDGRAQPPGGGDGETALHRLRETLPGYKGGGERSRYGAGRGRVPVNTGTLQMNLGLRR